MNDPTPRLPSHGSLLFDRWPRFAARHPWRVLAGALALIIALGIVSNTLARIHRRDEVTTAEWAMRGKWRHDAGAILGRGGRCLSSVAAGRPCDRLRTLGRARWWGEDAARNRRGPGSRELAGTLGCPLGGSGADVAVRRGVESLAAGPGRGRTGFPRANAWEDAK